MLSLILCLNILSPFKLQTKHYGINKIFEELLQAIEFPFDIQEVEEIESNCGSVWINLTEGSNYYITLAKCEE